MKHRAFEASYASDIAGHAYTTQGALAAVVTNSLDNIFGAGTTILSHHNNVRSTASVFGSNIASGLSGQIYDAQVAFADIPTGDFITQTVADLLGTTDGLVAGELAPYIGDTHSLELAQNTVTIAAAVAHALGLNGAEAKAVAIEAVVAATDWTHAQLGAVTGHHVVAAQAAADSISTLYSGQLAQLATDLANAKTTLASLSSAIPAVTNNINSIAEVGVAQNGLDTVGATTITNAEVEVAAAISDEAAGTAIGAHVTTEGLSELRSDLEDALVSDTYGTVSKADVVSAFDIISYHFNQPKAPIVSDIVQQFANNVKNGVVEGISFSLSQVEAVDVITAIGVAGGLSHDVALQEAVDALGSNFDPAAFGTTAQSAVVDAAHALSKAASQVINAENAVLAAEINTANTITARTTAENAINPAATAFSHAQDIENVFDTAVDSIAWWW